MAISSTAKRSAWMAVPLYHPFFLLMVGPAPALGLALWNAFHLRAPGRWMQGGIALAFVTFVSALLVYAAIPAAIQLAAWTGLPVEVAGGLVKTVLIFVTGMAVTSLTLRQMDAYKTRLFKGPVPTEKLRLMLTFMIIAFIFAVMAHRAEMPMVQQALVWRTFG